MGTREGVLLLLCAGPGAVFGQTGDSGTVVGTPVPPTAAEPANPEVSPVPADARGAANNRVLGVMPNYRTAEGALPFQRLTGRQKMSIAVKDSIDWPIVPLAAAFAGVYQLENQNPSFGQGANGYGKRLLAAYGDQAIGNFMTEGIVPSLIHQDPRYFRLGEGTIRHRLLYSLSRIVVARSDAGKWTFNMSEVGGNALAAACSNLYYPDTRNAKDNANRLLLQLGTDALGQVGKEFWPDVQRRLFHKQRKGG
jgi:hypothetical protein